jgi:hypothetical protein
MCNRLSPAHTTCNRLLTARSTHTFHLLLFCGMNWIVGKNKMIIQTIICIGSFVVIFVIVVVVVVDVVDVVDIVDVVDVVIVDIS